MIPSEYLDQARDLDGEEHAEMQALVTNPKTGLPYLTDDRNEWMMHVFFTGREKWGPRPYGFQVWKELLIALHRAGAGVDDAVESIDHLNRDVFAFILKTYGEL